MLQQKTAISQREEHGCTLKLHPKVLQKRFAVRTPDPEIEVINEAQKYTEGEIIPWQLRDGISGQTKGLPKTDFAATERLAKIFNKEVIWSTIGDEGRKIITQLSDLQSFLLYEILPG